MKCVGFEQLLDYIEGRLPARERKAVEAHLAEGCSKCTADRKWYERLRAVTASDRTIEPPPWVLRRAVRLFEGRQPDQSVARRVARGIAQLVFDSLKQPAPSGVRSAGAAQRQLLYYADNYSMDLQMTPSGQSRVDLTGQVLCTDRPGFELVEGVTVRLERGGESVHSTVTNYIGEFMMSGVEAGEYDLHLDMRDRTITVSGLSISPTQAL